MNDVTVISYPSVKNRDLLSLTDLRSKYMIPVAGKFRVADFTMRNASALGAKRAIIFNDVLDDLSYYVDAHPVKTKNPESVFSLVSDPEITIDKIFDTVSESETKYYVFFNGDNPAFIDIDKLFSSYLSKKTETLLFKIKIGKVASMSHAVLITKKRALITVLKKAKKENRTAPNIFEMLINMLIIKGAKNASYSGHVWSINSIADFYKTNMFLCKNAEMNQLLYDDEHLISGIEVEQPAGIGMYANIRDSFISDGCIVNGRVENSILFPGVIIAEKAFIIDSIILPYVAIGNQARLERTIVDEFSDYNNSDVLFNLGEKTHIGSDKTGIKNEKFPKILNTGLTLIGKNCIVPPEVNIGASAFIESGCGYEQFGKRINIRDGESLIVHNLSEEKNR